MAAPPGLYTIRIKGQLGATVLSAFPSMASELNGGETVLTGLLEDRSAGPQSPEPGDVRSPDGV